MRKKIFYMLIFILAFSNLALGADSTQVTADNMVYSSNKQEVTFEGKVYVKNKDMELWADRITIFLAADEKKDNNSPTDLINVQAGEIDKIVAERNVRFASQGYTGQSTKATYTAKSSKVVLEGNPTLKDGVNSLTGEVINYYLKENKAEVQGSTKQRVEAVFTTNGKDLGALSPVPQDKN